MLLNAGLLLDIQNLERVNADGIDLYRTEVPFMAWPALPNVKIHTLLLYGRILSMTAGCPVAFHTFYVDSDKMLLHWLQKKEPNLAMGWRLIPVA